MYFSQGAPESVFKMCSFTVDESGHAVPLSPELIAKLEAQMVAMAAKG